MTGCVTKILYGMIMVVACLGSTHAAPSAAVQKELDRVVAYLNQMTTVKADFIQTNPDGSSTEGTLALKAPEHIKMTYDTFMLLVTDSKTLIHYDIASGRRTFHSFQGTPLELLLQRPFVLDHTVQVLGVHTDRGCLKVTLAHAKNPDQGTLTLTFNEHPFQLRSWDVVDVQNNTTSVALVNLQEHIPLTPGVFSLPKRRR